MKTHLCASFPFLCLCILTLAALSLLQGCAAIHSDFEKPTVTASDLKLSEIKALEAVFLLELRVMNPNDFALDIRGVSCELNIEGSHFATGIGNDWQEIPAYGTKTVPITVYASMIDVVGSVIQFLQGMGQQQPLHYELTGKVRLGGYGTVPFTSKGKLDPGGMSQKEH
ncbi:MAG: hypothetical protein DSY58_00435 [Desulfobulbus sp.]|nr:MAG: hypothetical protein DSY58_00435 [Desulfobulbus sp.]